MTRSIFMATLFALLLVTPVSAGDNDLSLELFMETSRAADLDTSKDIGIIRHRYANLRTGLFSETERSNGDRQAPGSVIQLNLFHDVYMTAVLEHVKRNDLTGSISWLGYIDEEEFGDVVIVINKDGIVSANIVSPRAFYQIRYAGNGVHSVRQLDQAALPGDADPIEVQIKDSQAPVGEPANLDNGSVVDVMVVYTAAARSAAGGTSAMESLIDLAVTETNDSYDSSGVNFNLNLVHSEETSYVEASYFGTNLDNLGGKTDGYLDDIHATRDAYCADAVALIIEDSSVCGMAYQMTSVSASFESQAFSVTSRSCATGYYSFGHELGHNMGAHHDWHVDSSTSPYIYNHGYVNIAAEWRTVMAYGNACSDVGASCTRLKYWSNPNVNHEGAPMGVGGSTVGSAAHNALALSNTAYTVANFRDSSGNCGGGGGCSEAPATPTGLAASNVGDTSFTAGWSASSTATTYDLERWVNGAWQSAGSTSNTSYSFTGLSSGSSEFVRVRAANGCGNSDYSGYLQVDLTGGGCSGAPAVPTGLTGTALSSSSFRADWNSVSGATSYDLLRWNGSTWVDAGSSSTTSFTFTGLSSGAQYVVVRASNACGSSGYTGWIQVNL